MQLIFGNDFTQAALNVGGIVLNALAMEHFILRHPCESTVNVFLVKYVLLFVFLRKLVISYIRNVSQSNVDDEEEMLLRHAYGLGYPEPNITFALCRGSWSSPAVSKNQTGCQLFHIFNLNN